MFLVVTACAVDAWGQNPRELTELTVAQARELAAKQKGDLSLDRLETLTPEVASELAKHQGTLLLVGLKTLTPETAAALANHDGPLFLNGLTTISTETATALAKYQDFLWLDGLKILTSEVATELAQYKGKGLLLKGVTTLTPEVAQELAKHQAKLHLGLTTLSPETAAVLSKHQGEIYLDSLQTISPAVTAELVKNKRIRVRFRGLEMNSSGTFGRKSEVRDESRSKVLVNAAGQLAVGGAQDLLLSEKLRGTVLQVEVSDPVTSKTSRRFIAYQVDEDAKPELKLVEELGPGCYWKRRIIPLGAPRTHTIYELNAFEVSEGPYRGWLLQQPANETQIIISKDQVGRYIGVTLGYGNLDDGK